ncbi:MAG: 3-isopropylmalate dehydrogenase [Vicinamibacterales bacterium]
MNATILTLPGDGIGPEVTQAAVEVLKATGTRFGHTFHFIEGLIGGAALRQDLAPLPDATLDSARRADAILLGAVGDQAFDTGDSSRRPESALLALRSALGLYANLRPARVWPGLEHDGPLKPSVLEGTDLLVVRELTGGLYYGEPRGLAGDGQSAVNTMRYSRAEIERIAHVAFRSARGRRRCVTSVDKANVLEVSRLWREVVTETARAYADVTLDHMYVDACAMKLALAPASFDVVLTENLFGDILSDEAGAIVGSLGLLPSASLGEGPGLFEPVHGSAPDIAGRGIANPIGAIASAAMLLDHGLRLVDEARAVTAAIEGTLRAGIRPADLAGKEKAASTREVTAAIVRELTSRQTA